VDPLAETACYRHPDRVAGVRCQRCERPVCPTCMRQASVGFHCPECVSSHSTKVVTGRAAFGRATDPVATKALIGLNLAAFVAMAVTSGQPGRAAGPVFINWATFGPGVATGEWYRLVTGAFLHAGVLHLGMNMFLLWLLGQALEPALGRARFVGVYAVSLLGGSLGVMLLDPAAPTVGASGAVFGLMGALVVLQLRAGQSPWQSGIGTLVVLNLIITFAVPGISIGGHVGGLVAGGMAALGLSPGSSRRQVPAAVGLGGLAVLGLVLAVAGVIVAREQFPVLVG